MTIQLRGLVAATHTPFHADGQVNLSAVEKQADHLHSNGVKTVFIGGTTGESSSLTVKRSNRLPSPRYRPAISNRSRWIRLLNVAAKLRARRRRYHFTFMTFRDSQACNSRCPTFSKLRPVVFRRWLASNLPILI